MAVPYSIREVGNLQNEVCAAGYQSEETKRVIRLIETVNDLNRRLDEVYRIAVDEIDSFPATEAGMRQISKALEAAVCDDA